MKTELKSDRWKGKTVWLTGASSGIGRSLATKLAKLGATVVISARSGDTLQDIARCSPQRILPLTVDVTDNDARENVQAQLAERVESIDVAIFAAGAVEYEDDLDFNIDRYQKIMNVNFMGMVNSVAIAMPLLKQSSHKPYIVGITSLTVLAGFPRAEIYGASKAAADYFLKALRMDLSPDKFDLSIIRPGFVKTPMTEANDFPMPFIMSVDEASDRIIKAMNKRKLMVNFPKRFSLLLSCLSFWNHLWYGILGPKLKRNQS